MPAQDHSQERQSDLSRLSVADFDLLEPHLTAVDLPLRKPLEVGRRLIEHVYFLESGIASVVANGDNKRSIEVGLIGREGMTGLAVVMGTDRSPPPHLYSSARTRVATRCRRAARGDR